MKNIVVLGSSGFIGRSLCDQLRKEGFQVQGFSSKELDLTSPDCVEKLKKTITKDSTVYFISALTPDRGRDSATLVKNIQMAHHFSSALQESPCSHLIYISSDAVYADDVTPVNENSACAPSTYHGVMHLARELILKDVTTKKSIPFCILRPSAVYGNGDTHNGYGPNRFLKTALESGKISLFGGGEEIRDHVYIDDVIHLCTRVLKEKKMGVFNAVSFAAQSFMDAACEIKASLKNKSEVTIETSPRQNPVTHRHFDGTFFYKSFPGFLNTSLTTGIQNTISQRMEK